METKLGNGNKMLLAIMLGFILVFFLLRFGAIGLRTILGIIILFFAPIYIILNRLELDPIEKVVFTIFLGVGIAGTIVYFLGIFISFRIAIVVTGISLFIIGFLVNKIKFSK